MIKIGNKIYRNMQEQVCQNANDIEEIKEQLESSTLPGRFRHLLSFQEPDADEPDDYYFVYVNNDETKITNSNILEFIKKHYLDLKAFREIYRSDVIENINYIISYSGIEENDYIGFGVSGNVYTIAFEDISNYFIIDTVTEIED